MSYRPNLLLVTCVTCLGFAPNSATGLAAALENQPAARWSMQARQVSPLQPLQQFVAQATPSEASIDLKIGSAGQQVAELQAMLQQLGYYNGIADGNYGDGTRLAVIKFQTANELRATGKVGSGTWKRLKQAVVESIAPQNKQAEASATAPLPATTRAVESPTDDTKASNSIAQPLWIGLALIAGLLTGIAAFAIWKYAFAQRSVSKSDDHPASLGDRSQNPPPLPGTENGRNGNHHNGADTSFDQDGSDGTALTAEPQLSEPTRLPKIDIVEELIKDLHNPDPKKRRKAIWELGQRGNSKAIQPLVDLMMDSDSYQRSLILASVSEITVRALKPMNRALLISLQDESSEVRKNAIRDLTRVYDLLTQASQLLRHAVEDADEEVQETARWALGQLNRLRVAPESDNLPSFPKANSAPEHLPGDTSDSK